MSSFFSKLGLVLKDSVMRKRIIFTVVALVLFRFLATIPVPGVDVFQLERLLSGSQLFGFLNIFSGGGLSNLSIVMLGVGPYITASIIMQLGTMMIPRLKEMYREEGEAGRARFSQYSRLASVPLALIQSYGFLALLQSQNVLAPMAGLDLLVNVVIVATGSVLLMWIGELITEFGIGNGTSLIIFAGIVSVIPSRFIELVAGFTPALITVYAGLIIASVLVIIGVVAATEAERAIPVTYAKQSRGGNVYGGADTYIPFRLNQAGVIPIIFALSILVFPQMLVNILSKTSAPFLADLAFTLQNALTNPYIYGSIYFVLVVLLTFFYTSVTFEPVQIAEDLQKRGAFIPGVRPGEHTVHYLSTIVTRITLIGALFLGIVAVLPVVIQAITGNSTFAIGGTALLIVVSVVLDLIKKVDAQAAMREY